MADFSALKAAIQAVIKQNGNQEITGPILQEVLLSMVNTMGDGAINSLASALSTEITNRQNADGTLQQGINSEASTRGNADTTLQNNINSEANTRSSADTALQNAINAIHTQIDNGYVYAGIATPSTSPATGKVFYIAVQAGTYTNFGSTIVTEGITILKFVGSSWVKEQLIYADGGVFDITAYNGGTTYANLSAALGNNGANIPEGIRKGGMSVKYVQSSDDIYVQYRFLLSSFTASQFANANNWQRYDDVLDMLYFSPTVAEHTVILNGGLQNRTSLIIYFETSGYGGFRFLDANNESIISYQLNSAGIFNQEVMVPSNANSIESVYGTLKNLRIYGDGSIPSIANRVGQLDKNVGYPVLEILDGSELQVISCNIKKGHSYKVKNLGKGSLTLRTRQTESGANIDYAANGLAPNAVNTFTASADAAYVRIGYGTAPFKFILYDARAEPDCLNVQLAETKKDIDDIHSDLSVLGFETNKLTQDDVCDNASITSTLEFSRDANIGMVSGIYCHGVKTIEIPLLNTEVDLCCLFFGEDDMVVGRESQTGTEFTSKIVNVPNTAYTVTFNARSYKFLKEQNRLDKMLDIDMKFPKGVLGENGKREVVVAYGSRYPRHYFSQRICQKANDFYSEVIDNNDYVENLESTTGVFVLPPNYSAKGKPCPVIMYSHGTSTHIQCRQWGTNANLNNQISYWASLGYAVFDCNGARNSEAAIRGAGCPQNVSAFRQCWEYIKRNYNVEDSVYVIGASGGGLTALNFCRFTKGVKAFAALEIDMYIVDTWLNTGVDHESFFRYYGFDRLEEGEAYTLDNYEEDKVAGWDLKKSIVTIDNKTMILGFSVPIKFWAGANYQGYMNFIEMLSNGGTPAFYRLMPGLDHMQICTNSKAVANDVIDWFKINS